MSEVPPTPSGSARTHPGLPEWGWGSPAKYPLAVFVFWYPYHFFVKVRQFYFGVQVSFASCFLPIPALYLLSGKVLSAFCAYLLPDFRLRCLKCRAISSEGSSKEVHTLTIKYDKRPGNTVGETCILLWFRL